MAEEKEEFDTNRAQQRQDDIMNDIQWIRDGLKRDIIEWYQNARPKSVAEEKDIRRGMRKYLSIAQDQIKTLLNGKLY